MNLREAKTHFETAFLLAEKETIFYWLLSHLTGKTKLQMLTDEIAIDKAELDVAIARLNKGEPIQHIIGRAHFLDLELNVNRHTLIPRPETEELVEWMVRDILDSGKTEVRILDIGTGSACIALALKQLVPHAEVHALDSSREALAVAKSNSELCDLSIALHQVDVLNWRAEFPSELEFDFIVSNPPYVLKKEAAEMQTNVLDFEPHLALFVEDDDPLLFYREILTFCTVHLKTDGRLFYEIHEKMAGGVLALMAAAGLSDLELRQDLQGKDRMIRGRRI